MSYPTSLDTGSTLPNPVGTDPLSLSAGVSHSSLHGLVNAAIIALETKVGVTGSIVVASHEYRITHLESAVGATSLTINGSTVGVANDGTWTFPGDVVINSGRLLTDLSETVSTLPTSAPGTPGKLYRSGNDVKVST